MSTILKVPTIFSAIDKFTPTIFKMTSATSKFADKAESDFARAERSARKVGDFAANIGKKAAIGALAIAAPLAVMANDAIKFQDRLADVSKTTGLSGKALEDFGDSLLNTAKKSRTSIEDLLTIGEIGGQLGVAAKDLISFTDASNKFSIALGADYGGTEIAITQVGKIQKLFKETREMDIASVITKSGSAINTLGSIGSATSANINDFILRMGALPDAIKPSLQSTAALGAFFEEAGIDSQIAAGGLSNFFLVAGKNISGFAKQMGIGEKAAKGLLASDPTEFANKFSVSINKLSPDKLAKKLNKLGIGSQETIKVLGALGSGTDRLTELQNESFDSFAKGTSIIDEYNTKNNTVAGKIKQATNNFQVFSITLGTQLIPIITELIDKVAPVIRGFIDWIKENKGLTQTILLVAGGISAFLGVVSLVSGIVTAVTKVQWLWNLAMAANPIGLIIIGITALIGVVALVISKWDEWGAAIAVFMGPLGMVISLIQSLRRNWDMISKAFKEDGIIAGIKAIGKTIFDAILQPVEQLLEIIGKITGFEWATNAAKSINNFRSFSGVSMAGNDSQDVEQKPALGTPMMKAAEARQDYVWKGSLGIDINDPGGHVKSTRSSSPLEPNIKITSTQGAR